VKNVFRIGHGGVLQQEVKIVSAIWLHLILLLREFCIQRLCKGELDAFVKMFVVDELIGFMGSRWQHMDDNHCWEKCQGVLTFHQGVMPLWYPLHSYLLKAIIFNWIT
jgi:hypothetical protein